MLIKFLADCHIGNPKKMGGISVGGINARGHAVLEAFRLALFTEPADQTVILGDLFDTSHPSSVLLTKVQMLLDRVSSPYNYKPCVLVGNHDLSSTSAYNHACSPLWPVAEVYEKPLIRTLKNISLIMVPYQPGAASDWLHSLLQDLPLPAERKILCLHLGISDSDTPAYLDSVEDSITARAVFEFMEEFDIEATFAGNWHERKTWRKKDRLIAQVSSTAPTGFRNPGFSDYGYTVVYDTDTRELKWTQVPGPRFMTIDDVDPATVTPLINPDQFADFIKQKNSVESVYLMVNSTADRQRDWSEALKTFKLQGLIQEGGVRTDKKVLAMRAFVAAVESADAATLKEAIDGFIAHMDLPNGVTRSDVRRLVREAL